MDTPGIKLTQSTRGRNWVTGSTWGENTHRQSMGVTYRPLPEGTSSRHRNNIWAGTGGNLGGGSGGGRTPRRKMSNRVQGRDDGGRSPGGNRRGLEQAVPGGTEGVDGVRDVPNEASEAVRLLQQTALMLRSFWHSALLRHLVVNKNAYTNIQIICLLGCHCNWFICILINTYVISKMVAHVCV